MIKRILRKIFLKKVDCSTLKLTYIKSYNGRWVAGQYSSMTDRIYLNTKYLDTFTIKEIAKIITHESLHKILYHTCGDNASNGLDDYLVWKDNKQVVERINHSGLCD